MHLTRIQIPEFRAFKNVDITFEKYFTPKVFPLGSENGGGKSTLLQLIFVLLHCASQPNKSSFVEKMLARYHIYDGANLQTLAKMDIWNGEKTVQIEFLCCKNDFFQSVSNANALYLASYSEKEALFCHFFDFPLDNGKAFLNELSEKVFLAAPSAQVYLFMLEKEKKFFAYDFFSTDIIVKYFQDARNLDFEQFVNTGEYGNRYQQILNDINQILMPGKKILPQIQSSQAKPSEEGTIEGIVFKTKNNEILFLEDLSHGELKRLSLYVWIQYHRMKDAIVLMDEVENGFHPDWQYQIISDLVEWGANNQYILATHSYELCQAVTPAHVKEI